MMRHFLFSLLFLSSFAYGFSSSDVDPLQMEIEAKCSRWSRYDYCFEDEDVCIAFPRTPYVSRNGDVLTASVYLSFVQYILVGYYPPRCLLNPFLWFEDILYSYSTYPYYMLSHTQYQDGYGDWILDYTVYDSAQDAIIKGHSVVTEFNAYTLKCVKQNGVRDEFDYFVDNFRISCICDHY